MSDLPTTPTIDYTNKDFASFRQALLDLAVYRVPEWTDRSQGDLGMLFVDMFSYVGDVVSYYQDRLAGELYLDTAVERRSVMNLLRLLDYQLKPAASASGVLSLWFAPPEDGTDGLTTIPHGLTVSTKAQPGGPPSVSFSYLGPDIEVDLRGAAVTADANVDGQLRFDGLTVRQGTILGPIVLGSSNAEPGLRLKIPGAPVQLDTIVIEVFDGGRWTEWPQRTSLYVHQDETGDTVPATSDSIGYVAEVDPEGETWIVFGDGEYHRRVPVGIDNVRVTCLIGGGPAGNVRADTVVEITDKAAVPNLEAAANRTLMSGGDDPESVEHARRYAPLAFRSRDRAVTLRDHVTLARQVPGVAKVAAETVAWNRVDLHVVPAGDVLAPVSSELRNRLIAWFEDRRMIGTTVRILDAKAAEIEVSLEVLPEMWADPVTVLRDAEQATKQLYGLPGAEFGQSLFVSKVFEAVEAIEGIRAVNVTRFGRIGRRALDLFSEQQRIGKLRPQGFVEKDRWSLPSDGRISLSQFEIPVLGELNVTLGKNR